MVKVIDNQKKNRKQLDRKILKVLKKKVSNKKIVKGSKTTLHLQNKEYDSILSDPNRFFKDEWDETKRSMF
jgi:hypothetical protein